MTSSEETVSVRVRRPGYSLWRCSSPLCTRCGGRMARTHRTLLEKVAYSLKLQCPQCGGTSRRLHHGLQMLLVRLGSRYAHCVRCGSSNVHRLAERDRIDSMSWCTTSILFRLTAAPLNRCPACRLQFYDWRPPAPPSRNARRTAEAVRYR
jgi:hypothetical protein